MWNQRDRLLAWMFGVQLVAALAFGFIVANNLSDDSVVPVVAGEVGNTGGGVAAPATDGSSVPGGGAGGPGQGGADALGTGSGGEAAVPGGSGGSGGAPAGGGGGQPGDGGAGSGQPGTTPPAGGSSADGGGSARAEGTRTGVTDSTVRIGVLVTQTGAINFKSSAQATKAYVDMINEKGGINGRRIEVILRDDGLDSNKGQQAVQEMLDAGVFSFVAFNAPLTEQSVLPILEKNNIPLIGAFAIPDHPLGYIFSGPYETYGKVGGETLCQQKASKIGLIYISNQVEETDRTIEESYRAGAKTCGKSIADEDIYPVDVTKASFDDVVTSLRFSGVDGIATILDATAMIRLQQSLNRAAYSPIHVSSPFGGDPEVLRNPNVGSSFEGTFVLSDVEFLGSSVPAVQRYESEVKRRFGGNASINWAGQHGWLGTHIFAEVLRSLGADPTREALIERMNSLTDFETGFTVPLTITADPSTHNGNNPCMKVGKVVNGKVQQIRDWQCPKLTGSI